MNRIIITSESIDEPRLIQETGLAARVASIAEQSIRSLGYRLVRVRLSGLNGMTLQIMAEHVDGTMTIEDCELVSRTISPALDIENLIEQQYHLEVSSPGIDRPLVRKSDFFNCIGHLIKAETCIMINRQKKFCGCLVGVDRDNFSIDTGKTVCDQSATVQVSFSDLVEARLVLTDALIRDALQKDKALREQSISGENSEKVADCAIEAVEI